MRALLLGAGSIGRRHARNLRDLGAEVRVTDADAQRARAVGRALQVPAVERGSAEAVDVVIVATPSSCHVDDLEWALDRGAHVFVEKPLAVSWDGLARVRAAADSHPEARVMVGCNLRFSEGFTLLRAHLPRAGRIAALLADFGWWLPAWRPSHDYRVQYSSRRELGGGIVLDAIHEIDYALALAGPASDVTGRCTSTGMLKIDVEDVADIIVTHASGAQSHIHVDYLRRTYTRCCTVIGAEADLRWDFAEGTITFQEAAGGPRQHLGQELDADRNNMYLVEMRHFLEAVSRGLDPINGVDEAIVTTEIALRMQDARSSA